MRAGGSPPSPWSAGGWPTPRTCSRNLRPSKQAAAKNQQALRSYSWLEKTELSLKGEVKSTKVDHVPLRAGWQGPEDAGRGAAAAGEEGRTQEARWSRKRLAR